MSKTALLVMDVQRSVLTRFPDPEYLPRLAKVIDTARAADVPVIYVVVGFRDGFPEVSPNNKIFGRLASAAISFGGDSSAIPDEIAPKPGEIVVTKKRVSAFAGSDLEMVLRAQGIDSLVLTGIATHGVVLSTVRQAADLDYRLTVLADCCLDADPEVHRVLTEKVFPVQADVVDSTEWHG